MSSDPISRFDSSGHNYCTNHHDTYPFIAPTPNDITYSGKYVVVTGASRGIGKATAISFAQKGAAGIAILARSSLAAVSQEIIEAAKSAGHPAPKVVTAAADITSKDQVEAAAKAVSEAFGKLDVIVLNAGTLETLRPIADQDPMDWWFSYETSVLGSFLCLKYFIPILRQTDGLGTILAIGSVGSTITMPGVSGVPTAKLALTRLMEHVNCEYGASEGKTGLIAYTLHPGAVDHPNRTDIPDVMHEMSIDTVELAADTTTWLLGERREWLAGRWVNANWNMEELLSKRAEIERRNLLKFRLAMGGEDATKI